MKVAVVTKYRDEMDRFTDHLAKAYDFTSDVDCQEGRYTNVYTIKKNQIDEMLNLLETITGIDARIKTTDRKAGRIRKVACYLLRARYGLSHTKIAKMLCYKTSQSSMVICRDMKDIKINEIWPIELAIRTVLSSLNK